MENIQKRFKKTKIGLIPKDWEVKRLKDIADRIIEKNINNSLKIVFSNSALNGLVMQDEYFDKSIANKNNLKNYYIVNNEDFVYNPRISKYAPAGPINKNRTGLTGLVSPLYTIFRLNKKLVSNYFEYYFHSNIWLKYMKGVANYGARHDRMNITNKDFMNMPIIFPPLKEQKKISKILSTWDRAIEKQEELIKAKERLKKGLMQKLLTGKVRFKEFGSGTLVPQNGGVKTPLPNGWKEVKLGEIGKIVGGGTPNTNNEDYWNGNILWFTPTEIKNKYIYKSKRKISELGLKKSSAKLLPKNTLLLTSRATIGDIGIAQNECTTNQGFQSIIVNENNNYEYFYYWFLQNKKELIKRANGSTFIEISKKDIEKILLIKPPLKEQQKIAKVLSTADREIELLKEELEQLKKQKKGLMQKLLTGKVRTIDVKEIK